MNKQYLDLVEQSSWLLNYVENKSYRVLNLGKMEEWDPKAEIPLLVKEVSELTNRIKSLGDI